MENEKSVLIEQKKKTLKRYKKNLACIARLEAKLIQLNDRLKSVRTSNFSDMPRGGTPITIDDLLVNKEDLERRISKLKAKGLILKKETLDEIDSLDDIRYCEVLEAFFIDCLTFDEIAERMQYTDRHVHRLYSEAISILSEICQ
jgi:DNA-directed RNA polymerase specialized sigma subunit